MTSAERQCAYAVLSFAGCLERANVRYSVVCVRSYRQQCCVLSTPKETLEGARFEKDTGRRG